MELEITPLRRTDVAEIARIHRKAFPDFFLSTLGEPFLRQFYKGFIGDSTAVAVVLRDQAGKPLGASVGSIEPRGFFTRLIRRQALGFAIASAGVAIRNPRAIARLARGAFYRGQVGNAPTPEGALWSSMCADPAVQGMGAGRLLMTGWENEARRLGATQAHLTTDAVGNDRIVAWYTRAGWIRSETFVTREGRKMHLYVKDLTQ